MRRVFRILRYVFLIVVALPVGALYILSLANGKVDVPTEYAMSPLLLNPPADPFKPITLKVVTFNIQDLPFINENRPQRMRAIAMKLLLLAPDVAGFQEAFVEADRAILLAELKGTRLVHHQYFGSGMVGSGLLIASAFPIEEVYFHQFDASAPWYKIWEGDFWAGKGVALARLRLPDNGGLLDFYNTHAQANYGNPKYPAIRKRQMEEMADFINKSRLGKYPAIAVGDVNCRVDDADYKALVEGAGLVRQMSIDSRIDHIFVAEDSVYGFETSETQDIYEKVHVNENEFELSDHKGYVSTIAITQKQKDAS